MHLNEDLLKNWPATDRLTVQGEHVAVVSGNGPNAKVGVVEFALNAVDNLGQGTNMHGQPGNLVPDDGAAAGEKLAFDLGIEIGSAGMGKDDVQETTFYLGRALGVPLTLELVAQQ